MHQVLNTWMGQWQDVKYVGGGEMARTSHDRLSKSNANYIFISWELPCAPDLFISLSCPYLFCTLKLISVWLNQSFQDIQFFTCVSLFKHLVTFHVKIRFPTIQTELINFSSQTMISQKLFSLGFPLILTWTPFTTVLFLMKILQKDIVSTSQDSLR